MLVILNRNWAVFDHDVEDLIMAHRAPPVQAPPPPKQK